MDEPAAEALALPLSLQRLWGMDRGTRPGQKPSLDVRRIAQAAIAIADERGLEAVSMARVAASLGVTTMALYRYVASKEELLELMLEVAAGDPPPLDPELEWRDALITWADGLARIYRDHPWSVDVPLPGPPRGPHQLAWAEQGMVCTRATTLSPQERLAIVMLLLVYVRGQASLVRQMTAGLAAAGVAGTGATEEQMEQALVQFATTLDPQRFPEFRALFLDWDGTEPHGSSVEPFDEASFGLDRILDGVELLVRRRGSAGRRG